MNYLSFLSHVCQNLPVPLGEAGNVQGPWPVVLSSQQSPWDLEMIPNPVWLWVSQGRCQSERRAVWNLCRMGVVPLGRDRQRGEGAAGRIHMPLGVLGDPRCSWMTLMQLDEY